MSSPIYPKQPFGPFLHCSNVFPTINRRGTPRKRRRSARLKDQAMALKQALADSWISHGEKNNTNGEEKVGWKLSPSQKLVGKIWCFMENKKHYMQETVGKLYCSSWISLSSKKVTSTKEITGNVSIVRPSLRVPILNSIVLARYEHCMSIQMKFIGNFCGRKMTWNRAFNWQLFCLLSRRFLAWVTERD